MSIFSYGVFACAITTLAMTPAAWASGGPAVELPAWSMLPFIGLLLTIGVMSFIVANYPKSHWSHFWENNNNKLFIALAWSFPVIILLAAYGVKIPFRHGLEEYISFISLLFALFVISGAIYLDGDLKATPAVNTGFLAVGSVLANFIGTTGASVLLIRPLLRTNSGRSFTAHIPVFFIFLVGNIGGCLLPIGDPPLFLGYLKGVPFFWTLTLIVPWLTTTLLLLGIFFIWDTRCYKKENPENPRQDDRERRPITIEGKINFLWLAGVLAAVILVTPDNLAAWGMGQGAARFLREYLMLGMTALSFLTAPPWGRTRKKNHFTFAPIIEVAYLFIGIFVAMIPALEILRHHGASLGIDLPWKFFWATGILSAVLDNAPTYLSFLSLAQGVVATVPGGPIPSSLAAVGVTPEYLAAISLGAVFMGAASYIGNGPNFMVKAIAEEWGYQMPDFFSYILKYAVPILIPVFILITFLFL